MRQADGGGSFRQVVPSPVEGGQLAVVWIFLRNVNAFAVSHSAEVKIGSFLCANLDWKIRFFVGKAIRPMTSYKNL